MKSPYLLAIVSGLFIGTSYIPFPPWAIFFCFVPLWIAWLDAGSWKRIFFTGWITQFVLSLIGFNWVSYTVHEFGHLPWPVAIAVLFAFSGICTLSIPLAGVAWWFYTRRFKLSEGARIVALPVFMAAAERLTPMIFDWHFGYTWLWAGFPAYHLADIVGFAGLSNIGHVLNGIFLYAYVRARRRERWWPWALGPVVIFAALNGIGLWHAGRLETPDAHLRFLIVQANIGNEEKLMAEQGLRFRDTVLDRFYKLTEEGVVQNPGVDFAVWPETAFPEFIDEPTLSLGFPFKLRQMVTGLGIHLITGAYSHLPDRRPTNSFFILNKKGEWMAPPYHKTVLLAFGEYFPGAEFFPRVRQWFPEVADFGRGPGPTVLQAGPVRIGAQICYEGLFDWFTRRLADKGAQILVNVTNDSWYGTWEQPYQHLYMTLARAVEVRRPLVRATNTGISAVALASGEILPLSPVHQAWQHTYDVPYRVDPERTAFTRWGYLLFPWLLGLALLALPLTALAPLALWRKKL